MVRGRGFCACGDRIAGTVKSLLEHLWSFDASAQPLAIDPLPNTEWSLLLYRAASRTRELRLVLQLLRDRNSLHADDP